MKKIIVFLFCALLLSGCSNSASVAAKNTGNYTDEMKLEYAVDLSA